MKLKMLDLFSGIGGFSLAAHWTGQIETVAFCEIEPYCQKVLKKHWPDVPIFEDVRTLKGEDVGAVDIVCGGYPCQPFSTAGKRGGKDDDRHLWPEMFRLIKDRRPRRVLAENVAGHITMGLDHVLSDLEAEGYTCWPLVIPACAVGSRQRRDRVWILADSMPGDGPMGGHSTGGRREPEQVPRHRACEQESEPTMVAMVNGLPPWMDELRGYGNSIVPQVAYEIFTAMLAAN